MKKKTYMAPEAKVYALHAELMGQFFGTSGENAAVQGGKDGDEVIDIDNTTHADDESWLGDYEID